MKRKLPRKLRRHKRTEVITGDWTWGDITIGDASNEMIYFDAAATTVTFPSNFSSGFAIGDVITISNRGNEKVKKKKKVHVARRRKKEKEETHTITDISTTTMTIESNDLVTATHLGDGIYSVSIRTA